MSGGPIPAPKGRGWLDSIFVALKTHAYWLSVGFLRIFGWDLTTGKPYTRTLGSDIEKLFADAFNAFITGSDNYIEPTVESLVNQLKPLLSPAATPPVGNAGVAPAQPIAFSTSVGLSAAIAGFLISHFHIDAGEPLAHLAELMAAAVSFEEFRDLEIGPLLRNGIAKVAEMNAKALFQQELPGASTVASWVAMGLMTPAQAQQIMALNGLHYTLQPILQAASYRGMNARQLLRLTETGLFTQAEIQDELTFSAMRPVSQARMLAAAPYLATATYRSQLHSALYSAFEAGLMADADLTSAIDSAEQNTDRDNLILQAQHWKVLTAETKKLEAEYSSMFKTGTMDDATYRSNLASLGIQPGYINIIAGVAEAAANNQVFKTNMREAAALAKATAAVERKAALQSFKSGVLNLAAYTAALIATGLTGTQAAAFAEIAQLQQAGSLRTLYGLQLTPAAAAILKQQVTALEDQVKAGLLTPTAMYPFLVNLKIPANWQYAIVSAAAAQIATKKGAIDVSPFTGLSPPPPPPAPGGNVTPPPPVVG